MLLQALNEFYNRASKPDANGRILIQEAAFTEKYIRWNITLKLDGNLEGIGLTENPKVANGGRLFSVPKTNRPKVAGGVAEFLWDGLEAVFCLKPDVLGCRSRTLCLRINMSTADSSGNGSVSSVGISTAAARRIRISPTASAGRCGLFCGAGS